MKTYSPSVLIDIFVLILLYVVNKKTHASTECSYLYCILYLIANCSCQDR